jgi:hypothetical protein
LKYSTLQVFPSRAVVAKENATTESRFSSASLKTFFIC